VIITLSVKIRPKASSMVNRGKERTRRLIQNGALAEKHLGCEGMQAWEFESILKEITEGLRNSGNIKS